MSLSDDARTAIANVTADPDDFTAGGRTIALACADEILAVVMPDGRTIAQHLDDGAVASLPLDHLEHHRAILQSVVNRQRSDAVLGDGGALDWRTELAHLMAIVDDGPTIDPEAVARLQADR